VFARRRSPFEARRRLMRVEPCFCTELGNRKAPGPPRDRKTLVFSKTRKKTSGTLYSVFKEPDPRGPPADDAVLPASTHRNFRQKANVQYRKIQPFRQRLSAASR